MAAAAVMAALLLRPLGRSSARSLLGRAGVATGGPRERGGLRRSQVAGGQRVLPVLVLPGTPPAGGEGVGCEYEIQLCQR